MAELYFAYGSNMSSARLHARVEGARALGAARLAGFDLVFDKPGQDGTAKANLRAAPSALAHGVLWELGTEALVSLDAFEPGYRRVRQPVEPASESLLSTSIEAWIYLHPGSDLEMAPSPGYLRHLLAGAREHALPDDLQRMLQLLM